LEATLNQSFAPLDSLLFTVVLATLAVGLPILVVLSTRFLWDRKLNLGRSKELEKLRVRGVEVVSSRFPFFMALF
jgi:hypothetical protein